MGVTWEHDDALDSVTADLVIQNFIRSFLAELDQAVTGNHNELFPLGVMPVLTLGDTRFADVDADLTALGRGVTFEILSSVRGGTRHRAFHVPARAFHACGRK